MNHKGTMSIITDDLIFRRASYDDNLKDININEYKRTNFYHWIITNNKNELVGQIKVVRYNDLLKTIQLDYIVNNNNILKDIFDSIFSFLFNEVSCNRIEIRTNKYNLENYMTFEGILRQAELIDKKFVDVKLYSIIKDEFVCD